MLLHAAAYRRDKGAESHHDDSLRELAARLTENDLIALLQTYVDVIALRKGPDAVPASWLIFGFSVLLYAANWAAQFAVSRNAADVIGPSMMAYLSGLLVFLAVAIFSGYSSRALQMMSTIIAVGSLLAILSIAATVLAVLLGAGTGAGYVGLGVYLWSIPVKGHILARTINTHWLIGAAIAFLEYFLRRTIESGLYFMQQGGVA